MGVAGFMRVGHPQQVPLSIESAQHDGIDSLDELFQGDRLYVARIHRAQARMLADRS